MKHQITVLILLVFLSSCLQKNKEHAHVHDDNTHSHQQDDINTDSYFGNYTIKDKTYGTKTKMKIIGDKRIMTTNALPNHKTGDFPNEGNLNTISRQNKTYEFPLNPVYTGKSQWFREPGIAINGIKFEPQTAEIVVCDSGENFRVEAMQNIIDLGLDFNHAHVQPTGAYHYHGVPTSIVNNMDKAEDLIHIGFAHDGFPMYYSQTGKYKPSFRALDGNRKGEDCIYENPMKKFDIDVNGHHDGTFGSDFEYSNGYGDLDECNGITIEGKYMYLVTDGFPYVGRCLMGETQMQSGPPNGQGRLVERPPFAQLLEMMDVNGDKKISKKEAKGPLSHDFEIIDKNSDGFLSEEELKNPPQQNRKGRRPQGGLLPLGRS